MTLVLSGMGFDDLGWYEFLFLTVVVCLSGWR